MRARAAAGIVGALMILASAFAHGLGGWPFMAAQLAKANAPAELQLGLRLGWMLGSAAMLVFGTIALAACLQRWRGIATDAFPLAAIAAGYGGYGIWALAITGLEPQFLVFVVPALLIGVAAPNARSRD